MFNVIFLTPFGQMLRKYLEAMDFFYETFFCLLIIMVSALAVLVIFSKLRKAAFDPLSPKHVPSSQLHLLKPGVYVGGTGHYEVQWLLEVLTKSRKLTDC